MKGDKVRTFHLFRHKDISGTSGTGIVCYGAILPSGRVVLEWNSNHVSLEIHNNIMDVEAIHGHNGATEVVYDTNISPRPKRKLPKLPDNTGN